MTSATTDFDHAALAVDLMLISRTVQDVFKNSKCEIQNDNLTRAVSTDVGHDEKPSLASPDRTDTYDSCCRFQTSRRSPTKYIPRKRSFDLKVLPLRIGRSASWLLQCSSGAVMPWEWIDSRERVVLHDPEGQDDNASQPLLNGKRRFRPAGSPAGTCPQGPYDSICWDPYERVCFYSHLVPGLCFLTGMLLIVFGVLHESKTLAGFLACAACTHIISAITHAWPDSLRLEKVDHLGIVALVTGTPITALLAVKNGQIPEGFMVVGAIMFAAAFLPRALRVIGFAAGVAVSIYLHPEMLSWILAIEMGLYILGALCFLRNSGQSRWTGFADHHFLHYLVTIACALHVVYIRQAMEAASHRLAPTPSP